MELLDHLLPDSSSLQLESWLAETLDHVFNAHGKDLKAVEAVHNLSSIIRRDGTMVVPISAIAHSQ